MPKLQNANLSQLSIMVVSVPRGLKQKKIKQTSIIVFALRLPIGGFSVRNLLQGIFECPGWWNRTIWYNLTTCCFLGACIHYVVLNFLLLQKRASPRPETHFTAADIPSSSANERRWFSKQKPAFCVYGKGSILLNNQQSFHDLRNISGRDEPGLFEAVEKLETSDHFW